ncbi:DEAD/DEAH box helicase [Paenibacillus sp. HJL G12]|uniref:DEAD/DEAH box helicase n=1 Tax=Paenibacillus dendrobii TaxID=2691084 RepID=A0A7X3IQ61_9BACL|nr:DEAD/DEAH box helicase [Paenibacillus dendrobii]MWV46875.1 DEAD/DEAH box helicase [Paenibacillus dendrobii]
MNATSFTTLGLEQPLADGLSEYGITEPTPVQSEAIPAILKGADVLARSQTGTGKTLAYLLPILQNIDPDLKSPQKLVIAPTQELAMQIVREGEKYGQVRGIQVLGLIGGAALKRQVEKLKQHPQLIIGTPGRVRELIEVRKLKMHQVNTIVVDEVDQVFQLGGAGDVDRIFRSALRDRQLVFLSATVSNETASLVKREMQNPVEIGIDPDQSTAKGLEHIYFAGEERDKMENLRRVIRHYNPKKAMVFVNQTESIAEVQAKLNFMGLSAEALYADADKMVRSRVLRGFRNGKFKVLVASDVAARGLDIEGLEMVVNYDPALDSEHYVHRAGRTGRMGRSGLVISLVTNRQIFIMNKFAKELGISLEERRMYGGKVLEPRAASSVQRSSTPRKPIGAVRDDKARISSEASDQGSAERRQGKENIRKPSGPAKSKNEPFRGGKPTERQSRSERERERKNKGAPKWLKDKKRP